MQKINKWFLLMTMLLALSLVLVACGGNEEPADDPVDEPVTETDNTETDADPAPTDEPTDEPADEPADDDAAMGDSMLAQAMNGDFAGTVVTVFSPAVDEDERKFNETMAAFEEATGIDIQYEGSKEFEAAISVRADAGNPPDIADFPQPGLLNSFVRDGLIVDLNQYMDRDYLSGQYIDSWLDMATMEGPDGPIMAGVWYRVFGKSQVFYPKGPWEAAGYEIPTTWDELLTLSQTISDDGDAPWCIGIESGVATGWTATDWIEDMMLRTTSLENYDAWVNGDLPFASPEVQNAAETMAQIWFNDDYVLGGRSSIATTGFGDAPTGMFDDPPQCWLHRQGSFITSFFPEGTTADDYGIFYLPPVDEAYGRPYLVSGDLFAAFNDRPEVIAVMEYMTKGESLQVWMEQGGALSPHKDADLAWYGSEIDAQIGAFIADATSVRFDASDLMPGEVGAGSFWTEMTGWVSGSVDLEEALQNIDASWPEGAGGISGDMDGGEDEGDEDMGEGMAGDGVMTDRPEILERAYAGEFDGTVVTVFSPAVDEDERKFNETVAAFEEATGIDIQYEGSKEFEAAISVRADAGNPPDIADFPQPGLLNSFVRDGLIVDISSELDRDYLSGQYIDSWLDMATMEGPDGPIMAGVWYRVFGKSQVFYPKGPWEAAGYEVPTTWDELIELSQTISDDGDAPWCIGIESGVATGWTATDWIEDMMLRTTSLENYDAWVAGDLGFASPEVTNAAETMAQIWFNDDFVLGGRSSIATTGFGDAPTGMFDDPPQCWLHRQGSFITSFFPEGTTTDDYGIFYLPPVDEAYGRPYLVSGDLFAAFDDRPEVMAVMAYLSRGESLQEWMAQGGALSPHKDANLDWYGSEVDAQIGAFIADATSVRFDASDLMPGEVGAGTFWTEMTGWVSGSVDLETALENIDASWPE